VVRRLFSGKGRGVTQNVHAAAFLAPRHVFSRF
jgi:hypothetical protein